MAGLGALLVGAIVKAAIGVATAAIGSLFSSKKTKSSTQSRDLRLKQNITDTAAYLPLVYGRTRVGGMRVFANTALAYIGVEEVEDVEIDIRGDYLYLATAICEGEIDAIEETYFDNVASTNPKFISPFQVDITLSWTFTRPDPVVVTSAPIYVLGAYRTKTTITTGGYLLTRKNNVTGETVVIYDELGTSSVSLFKVFEKRNNEISNPYTLEKTQFGNFTFYLYYQNPDGTITNVGDGTCLAETLGVTQTVDNGVTITGVSYQDGFYVVSDQRLGGLDNLTPSSLMTTANIGYSSDRIGNKVAYACHRLLKHTKGHSRPELNVFNQVPVLTFLVRGLKVYDPREISHDINDSTTWEWSDNPAVCMLDYLRRSLIKQGDITPSEFLNLVDLDRFIEAADYCDEIVNNPDGTTRKRYTINGVVETSQPSSANISEILSCANARFNKLTGLYFMQIMKPETPVTTFDQSVIIGNVQLQDQGIRNKQNRIKAQYYDPALQYLPNFVEVTNPDYLVEDKGKDLVKDVIFPFTTNKYEAQALATLALKESREAIILNLTTSFATYNTAIGDVIELDYPPFNFVNKKFRVIDIDARNDEELGIVLDYLLVPYSDEQYDEDSTVIPDNTAGVNLDNPFDVSPPSGIRYLQTFETNNLGYLIPVVNIYWYPSNTSGLRSYQVEYKPAYEGDFKIAGNTQTTGITLRDIPPAVYIIRVKAINNLGNESIYVEQQIEVVLPTDIPSDVENFQLKNNNNSVTLSWDTNKDIALGGFYIIKHIPKTAGAIWSNTSTFSQLVDGIQNEISLAQIDGTYMIKAVNVAGIESANEATIVLDLPDDTSYQTVLEAVEDPDWDGTKWMTAKSNSDLVLGGLLLFDDASGLFDDAGGLFDYGIIGSTKVGTYIFDNILDLGAVYKTRLAKNILASTSLAGINFDSASGLFDSRAGLFDGVVSENGLAINTLYRATRDDPAGSPSWGEWKLLTKNEDSGRAFQFKLELFVPTNDSDITITQARTYVQLPSRVENKKVLIDSSSKSVVFDYSFYSLASLAISIDNPATGDYYTISSSSETGFTTTVYNNLGSPVTDRSIVYTASGLGERIT